MEKEIKTFTEPGRGRRKCSCGVYIGVMSQKCVCGNTQFEKATKTDVPREIVTYTEAGPGRKKCECGVYIGGRISQCPKCNHVFGKKEIVEKVDEPKVVVDEPDEPDVQSTKSYSLGGHSRMTWVPCGNCPHRLGGTDLDSVREWSEKARDSWGNSAKSFLTLNGLQYWVRDYHASHSEEYKTVVGHLRQIYANEI